MKNKKNMRRFLSGFLAMLTVLSTILSPILSYAADVVPVPEEPPLYEEVKNELDADEVVKAKDLELETGSIFEVEKDFTGLEIPDEKKVKITFHEAKNEEKQDFTTDYEDTYKAVYYVEPVSGHPIYQINRKLIVKEAVVQVAESENQESVSNQEDENEAEGEEPAIGTAESEGPVQDEVNVEIPSEDEIYEEVTPTEIPVEEEPIDTPIPENPSEEVSTEEPAIDDNPDTDSTFEEITDTDPEETPEATDDSFTDGTEKTEDADGNYQVNIVRGEEFHIELNHEDGQYQPGETVVFSGDMPQGSLIAVGTTKVQANQTENTEDLLYSEVTYHEESDKFSFEMPADDIDLSVSMDQAENGIMLLATDTPWDDATNIEANKYYYYSDGQLHPFDTVMGQGGNDSYKYVRYKAGGKTYTVNAYCMQHSMQSPPSGTTYKNMVELDEGGDDKYLRKALFYGYGGPGWGHTFNGYNVKSIMEKYGCSSETRAMQHYLVDYLYDGESGFGGALSTTAKNMLKEIKAALAKMPDPTAMKLLPGLSVNATGKETESFTWKANEAFTITIHLENGVSLVNETTGKTASGNVTVKGGEKFHLVATTANMGSLKGKYAITSNFPLDFHAMLLKLESSQDIGFGYYTDSSDLQITVDWPEEAVIEITKKDGDTGKNLAGAVYGVYSDNACTKLIAKMPPTDSNGSSRVTLTKTQDTVYLKEITAPEGYVVQASSYGVKLVVGSTTKQTVTDKEQKGNLTVYKEGEVFVGAVSDENGTLFQYEKRRQKGAVYNVYAAEDIVTAGGKTVYKKGAEVAKNLITDENGSVTVKNLPLGSYNVTEAQAPENFYNAKETKKVTISYAGQTAEAAFSETTFTNDRQKAVVQVIKKDKDTENTLSGGHFALFAAQDMKTVDGKVAVKKDALIETAITGTDGKAAFKADLPVGFSYYVKEVQAPAGYVRNEKDTYSFQFSYTNDEQAKISFSHTFVNDRVSAAISLNKKDAETKENKAQGDASLENAVYGLYARNDITHPDGKTGVIYKAGSQIGTLTTDKEGKARIENLYLGEYYIKEITPSVGYLADEHEYDLVCSDEGDLTAVVEKECTSLETVKKQPFELIKAANNGDTDAALLSGAGFSAYLVSSLVVKEDGNYDFSSAEPVVIGENGATEIFTNEKGYVKSIAIPYGTYLVRETTTPHNYKPVDDFIVRITENKPTESQTWRVLLDKEFSAKLKIIKQDDETKKSVLIPGTEFKIYDMDHEKYVEQVTTYPTTVTHTSYFTDIDGYLILPQNLKIGHYRIEEVTAPDGYTINKNYVEIQVDTNTLYQTDPVSGDAVIEVVYEDHSVKGKLTVQKKGEVLSTYKNDFRYEVQNLSGAVYEVYAAEDIYTADFQKDDTGKRILKYAKGEKVAELTTDESGKAELDNLPLGEYKVVEKTAPEGFVLNEEEQKISFVYADQNTPVISQSAEFINDRQKVEVSVVKKDAENEKGLSGAEFGLYAKEDIKAGDKVLVKADELLTKAVTGEDGKTVFEQDLPFGTYYIKELAAPDGFVSSDEQIEVTAKYQGQEVKTVKLETVFKNEPTTTEFTKSDITTGVELDGATLTVLDSDGKEVEKWTSVKGKAHVIKRLHVGKTYTLREEFAPYGYLQAEEVKFTVSDTADIQKVEMKDAVPVGRIIINKKGEFVKEVTWKDMLAGGMDAAFGYVTGSLKDVTFEIYAAEDIKAADGESSDYYKKDELVATITTDALGYARSEDLPLGKYYVKEKETADGYVLDGEIREVDLTYRDQNTPVVTYDEDWQNNRQKAKVTVVKKEKNTDRVLEGGVFALYTKNDILNAEGEVILKADTMIEQKATDQDGRIVFTADLPINGNYYVKEVQAPAGFVTTEEIKEFDFAYAGEEVAEVSFEFTYEDEPTTFEITKSDITTGEELPGAKLKVSDSEGNVVDEWTSGSTPHIIKELEVGKKYTLTETIPADGYATAESITFVVENTADIQKVEMQDDTTKILISKVDMTDGSSEVKGAKLYILNENQEVMESWTSGDQPHYVEKLSVGTYTLLEETAPKGYIVANKVTFEVKDTGDVQGAKMEDEQAMGKVILNKTDKDTKKPMKGVEFALCDSKGKVLETLVTDSAGHAESKNYPIATFKNGQYKKAITYILKETKTLDGYQLDETEHKIQFEYVNDRTPVIEYTLDLTNKKAPEKDTPETSENQGVSTPGSHGSDATSVSNSPKTGDNTNIAIFVLALAVSAGCLGTVVTVKRKRK